MNNEPFVPMDPWFRGFNVSRVDFQPSVPHSISDSPNGNIQGTIEKTAPDKYKCTGIWNMINEEQLEITELPVRSWTQPYKEQIEAWLVGSDKAPALIKEYREYHAHTTVHFIVTLTKEGQNAIAKEGVEKAFRLASSISTSNMVVFDFQGKIRKYATPEEILDDFYDVRLTYYQKRKAGFVLFFCWKAFHELMLYFFTGVFGSRTHAVVRETIQSSAFHPHDRQAGDLAFEPQEERHCRRTAPAEVPSFPQSHKGGRCGGPGCGCGQWGGGSRGHWIGLGL
jgi:hypothetical protein